ncbi:E3 ubiquitin-protein ligase rnf8-A-like [Planococcus citri]|uniref:E3 ubiquitin-protein ligase rnf8-A-like n=1 Tax=Planococcus citri TaxID=170843 RepID=UPI0031F95C72
MYLVVCSLFVIICAISVCFLKMSANSHNYIGKKIRPWDVDKILDRKIVGGRIRYLVKWRRTFNELNTWEIAESFSDPSMIANFELQWHRRVQARRSVVVRQSLASTSSRSSTALPVVENKSRTVEESKTKANKVEKCSTEAKTVSEISEDSKTVANFKTLMETELQCCICFDIYKHPCVTECEHIFCDKCLETWKNQNRTCPVCRTVLTRSEKKLIRLDNFIEKVTGMLQKDD